MFVSANNGGKPPDMEGPQRTGGPSTVTFLGSLVIDQPWNTDLANQNSPYYKLFTDSLKNQVGPNHDGIRHK